MPESEAPRAKKIAKELEAHGDVRIDEYYWMRLTDEQKTADKPDEQTADVMDYLKAENAYTKKVMARTDELQEKLFQEIIGRIKQDDGTVPYFKNGYWYYSRFEEVKEYPVHCRKNGSLDAHEDILLDVNELAEGHEYFHAMGLQVSPDNRPLAYGEDTVGRRIYSIRTKNLDKGDLVPDTLPGTTGSAA